ncbi:unnamed protein product [Leptosia nina]|uniref:Uncharacterized protein n=1 Tax=Leptosia nina TaxID=320188 RepID=A0AAV1JHT3_9NEOP
MSVHQHPPHPKRAAPRTSVREMKPPTSPPARRCHCSTPTDGLVATSHDTRHLLQAQLREQEYLRPLKRSQKKVIARIVIVFNL